MHRNPVLRRAGEMWGEFLVQTVRGFEFAVALATLNNAILALQVRHDGTPDASFLRGEFGAFALPSPLWAGVFAAFGALLLTLFFASMKGGGFFGFLRHRAIAHAVVATLYAVVSMQVWRGSEPPFLAGRYVLTMALSLCVTVLLLRLVWNGNARKCLQSKEAP